MDPLSLPNELLMDVVNVLDALETRLYGFHTAVALEARAEEMAVGRFGLRNIQP
jgi:hypothetical protein